MDFRNKRRNIAAKLEGSIKHYEIANLPLNLSDKIGKGSCAKIYKYTIRKKPAAVKILKQIISKLQILKISIELRKLKNDNVVRFRGYSVKPTAFIFELCELFVEDETINNLSQLATLYNELLLFFISFLIFMKE